MSGGLTRDAKVLDVDVTASAGTTEEIVMVPYAGGILYIPSDSTITSLTFHVTPVPGGTYYELVDAEGTDVVLTVEAGKAYPFPVATYGCAALKVVGNAADTISVTLIG